MFVCDVWERGGNAEMQLLCADLGVDQHIDDRTDVGLVVRAIALRGAVAYRLHDGAEKFRGRFEAAGASLV